jgi:cytoskeletal protein RodZ
MEKNQPTPDGPALPGFGIARDVQQLKTHSAASAAELREFLQQMRARRPQEVLGLIAGSHLIRNIALATVGTLVILVVGTVGPWWLNQLAADSSSAAKRSTPPQAAASAPAPARKPEKPTDEPPPAATPTSTATDTKPSAADAEQAIKVMGLDDTKIADPKKNPLEKTLDNLLDKLE